MVWVYLNGVMARYTRANLGEERCMGKVKFIKVSRFLKAFFRITRKLANVN